MSISSKGYEYPDAVNTTAIKGTKVVFSPGKRLKKMEKALTFKQAENKTQLSHAQEIYLIGRILGVSLRYGQLLNLTR